MSWEDLVMSSQWDRFRATARYRLKTWIATKPRFYFPLIRMKKSAHLAVDDKTDITIEGFPRSANSFAVAAFEFAQPRPVKVAHHLHVPAQVLQSCRLSVPTLVLIRNPVDAIISLKALQIETYLRLNRRPPELGVGFKDYLVGYIVFYRSIARYRDHYVIGCFHEVTSDYGLVIDKLNRKFGTQFALFEHTEDNVKKVFRRLGFHANPSKEREIIKTQVRKHFERVAKGELAPLIDEAYKVYEEFLINS